MKFFHLLVLNLAALVLLVPLLVALPLYLPGKIFPSLRKWRAVDAFMGACEWYADLWGSWSKDAVYSYKKRWGVE